MRELKEITTRTVYDFVTDLQNGFLNDSEDMFIDYQSKISKPEYIMLEAGKLKYLMQHLLNIWLNLHIYATKFEINVDWNEFNKLISLDTSFLALTNSNNGCDIYVENLKECILKLPNAVIFTISEY